MQDPALRLRIYEEIYDKDVAFPEEKSVCYDKIGWAIFRDSWEEDATMLAVKCGDTWNHAHADAASFVLYKDGVNEIYDAGSPPTYVAKEDVPASVLDEEKAIVLTQLQNDPKNANKPTQILEKMVIGKVGKYYEANCLLEQAYVKDDKLTVGKYVEACAKEFGGKIKVVSFTLFEKGEGLQKREENFAEEIAKLAGGNK